jgi:protein involved in sex pheromone biosynthesis
MKRLITSAAISAALILGGCGTTAQWTATVAQKLSSSTPTQATTLADSNIIATGVHKSITQFANSGYATAAQLHTMDDFNERLNKVMNDLNAANAANQSIYIATLNEVLKQWFSYATAEGISH